ncbi:MAG: TatD family hydrolase [Eubacteriales bacterium]|nr:TatD family hydrolase [Eubacteriales bacterium]
MSALLFDSHCHLESERFQEDFDAVLARMSEHGVSRCLCAGSDMATSERIAELTQKFPFVYGAVGVHPEEIAGFEDGQLERMREWLRLPHVKAVGEIGLDYFYDEQSPRAQQKIVLEKQMDLACELDVPAVFHVRDAHGDMLDLLRSRRNHLPSGVMHCFSGSVESAREYLDLGFYLSFAGPLTFKNARQLPQVAAYVPLDRVLVETDSPYLAPTPMRGQRNEPGYVRFVAQKLAELRGLTPDELIAHTTENTERLFRIEEA